nr:MAG TPA: hypothetical protein [Caudoviricetes sp.]
MTNELKLIFLFSASWCSLSLSSAGRRIVVCSLFMFRLLTYRLQAHQVYSRIFLIT